MDPVADVVAGVAAIAAVAGAIVAIVQARSASADRKAADKSRTEAEASSKESARLAAIATDAFVRQAKAQERANELVEAAIPLKEPDWVIEQVGGSRYVVTNRGTAPGLHAFVEGCGEDPDLVDPDEKEPRNVGVGDQLAFTAIHVFGPDPKMRLTWTDPNSMKVETAERIVR